MTTFTYLYCFLAALLAQVIYLTMIKIPGIKARTKIANERFTLSQYLADDANGLIGSVATILLWLLLIREVITYKPIILPWIVTASAGVGFMGATFAIKIFGLAQKKLDAIVDAKTDIADKK